MAGQLLNEAETFLLERWNDASRLEKSMESIRTKYKGMFERVKAEVTRRHPELDSCGVWLNEGTIGFGRASWPHKREKVPSGLWVDSISIDQLLSDSLINPTAWVWVSLPRNYLFDFDRAKNQVMEEATKIGYSVGQLRPKDSDDEDLAELPAPAKSDIIKTFSTGDGEEFVNLMAALFDKLAQFIPVLDRVFKEYYEEEFRRLAADWHRDTDFLSSMDEANKHPAYQKIIRLGTGVVPLLLRDLEDNHTHWFAALEEITGEKPTTAAMAGNIPQMAEAWLDWAKNNGHKR